MEIRRSGSQPSGKGPADWFTGAVRIDPLLTPEPPARVEGLAVTFESFWRPHGLAYAPARPDADRNFYPVTDANLPRFPFDRDQ
jgi:hypothetical protein